MEAILYPASVREVFGQIFELPRCVIISHQDKAGVALRLIYDTHLEIQCGYNCLSRFSGIELFAIPFVTAPLSMLEDVSHFYVA